MADETDSGQRTEEPSSRKLQEGRQRGQVAQSREVNTWFMLMAGTGLVMFTSGPIARVLAKALIAFITLGAFLGPEGVRWEVVGGALGQVAAALMVPMLVMVVAAVAGTVIQIGFVFATERLGFDIARISPLAGLKRLFSARNFVEILKSIAKIGAVGLVAVWMVFPAMSQIQLMASQPLERLPYELESVVLRLMLGVMAVVTMLALGDFVYQRIAFLHSMRMSKQEVKEEHKQSEGDPTIRARLRAIRMDRARKRMMAAVPKASVVIANPTHYAVALKYEMGEQGAPKVVAKGADLVALRIREIAEENDVPVVENPPLARALYATVEIDREIPPEHYKAVAEIIGYVFRLKGTFRPQAKRA